MVLAAGPAAQWCFAASVLLCLAAAAVTPAACPARLSKCVEHGGLKRCWAVYQEPRAPPDGERPPLVVRLHGYTGCASHFGERWEEFQQSTGFVMVVPQGAYDVPGAADKAPGWNAGGCCGGADEVGVDDVGFLLKVIDDSVASLRVDPSRVYVSGYSNGCAMAQRLAVEAPRVVTAVACYAFYLLSSVPTSYRAKVPVLEVHGMRDSLVPFAPKTTHLPDWSSAKSWPGAEANLRTWSRINNCTRGPVTQHVEEFGGYNLTSYGCEEGVEVALAAIPGAEHWDLPDPHIEYSFLAKYRRNGDIVTDTGLSEAAGSPTTGGGAEDSAASPGTFPDNSAPGAPRSGAGGAAGHAIVLSASVALAALCAMFARGARARGYRYLPV